MENSEGLKLVGFWVSPFVKRVEWALLLNGLNYEYKEEADIMYNKSSLILELNPVHKKVPVLVHQGKPILESLVILEYIDETWKQYPLLPQDPCDKAKARFWAKFGDEKLMPNAYTAMWAEGELKQRALQVFIEGSQKLEEEIKGKKFFGGESIGYLDLALGWIPYWLPIWEEVGSVKIFDPIKFPSLNSWMKNILNHPIIQDKLSAPREKMILYFQERKEILSSAKHG